MEDEEEPVEEKVEEVEKVEEEEEEKEETEVEEVVEMRPTRGSVRGGVVSLPLTAPGRSSQPELSPDVFQIRAPIVSLESLVLSPASNNIDMEPTREVKEAQERQRAASLSSRKRELRQKMFSLNNKQLELEQIENCFELRAEEELWAATSLSSHFNCEREREPPSGRSWDLISLD